ncbi:STAS domain-containing protein [Alkalicoccus urumqiensis]|uniref:Anti-sigma factor antagonist n=1 Tax=Alkalicoccus urumqiensis TaxID=1548213 RepID=A0A2P6MI31_ALKUR|nr:STAS domain-containing protein [Alkalicoccus urumqiensis]PRO65920.1 anti-sigma factor antagonist [Alkalicoccus urumqiensis]
MILSIQEEKENVRVTLGGDIYVQDASTLREQLLPYAEEGKSNFVFDFSKVTFIDSAGLGVLVAIYKRAAQNNGGVRIQNPQPQVAEIFTLTRLHHVFSVDPS